MKEIVITYAGYILFLLTSIVAYLQFRGKKKLEIDKLQLEQDYDSKKYEKQLKYNAYLQYISRIDSLNHNLQNNLKSEELLASSVEMTSAIMKNPNSSQEAIKTHMDKMNRFIAQWGTEQYRSMEELSGVKLVCGEKLLQMLEEYSVAAKDYVDTTLTFMSNFHFQYPTDKESPELVAFKNKYDKMTILRVDIIKEMRKEIDINKTV